MTVSVAYRASVNRARKEMAGTLLPFPRPDTRLGHTDNACKQGRNLQQGKK